MNWVDPWGLAKHDPNSTYCKNLRNKIANVKKSIEKRYREYEIDENGLPEYIGPGESLHETRRGHRTLINKETQNLRRLERKYEEECGGGDGDGNCPIPLAVPRPAGGGSSTRGGILNENRPIGGGGISPFPGFRPKPVM